MIVNFRQGVVGPTGGFLFLNGSNNIDLIVDSAPLVVTVAQQVADYLFEEANSVSNAWVGPFSTTAKYWLFWDYDLKTAHRTFGFTTLLPLVQNTPPSEGNDTNGIPFLTSGRMWYDTSSQTNYYYNNGAWVQCLRVFAAAFNNGVFQSMGPNSAPNFTGTQIGNTTQVGAGRILFDDESIALHHADGTFVTTEDQFFANATRIDGIRLESNVVTALCNDTAIAAFTPVAWRVNGGVSAAQYDDTGATVVGMMTQDVTLNHLGSIIVQGTVTNLSWNWLAQTHTGGSPVIVGNPLWVSNGQLVVDDPHVTDVVTYPTARVPVARILNTNTVIFEQGLGGVGPAGPAGSLSNVSITAISNSPGLVILGSPVSTNGTLNFNLNTELSGVALLSSLGFVARTGVGTYVPRTFIAGSTKIALTNGGGTIGNPTIDINEGNLNIGNMGGILPISGGGTGQTSAASAINALLPTQLGNAGLFLTTNGSNVSWSTAGAGSGTVTSVAVTGSTGMQVTGSPITSSGTISLTLGNELQGLAGLITNGIVQRTGVGAYTTLPSLPINLGGTGQTTANAALNALLPTQTGNVNKVLGTDGTNTSWVVSSGTVSSVAAVATGIGLIITGSPITSSGTLTFALGSELEALSALSSTGMLARTAAATYTPRSIVGGVSGTVTVTNGNGVAGNPAIDFNIGSVSSLPSLYVAESHVTTDGTSGGTSLVSLMAAKQPNIQYQGGGANVGTSGGIVSVNFASGFTVAAVGSALTVSTVPVFYPITGATTGSATSPIAQGTFTIAGNETATFQTGFTFAVVGSTANNGNYTVSNSALVTGNTVITVTSLVPSSIADGNIYVGPGQGTVTSVDVTTTSTGLTSTGGPVTSSGSIVLSLNAELQGLAGLSANGIVQRTGAGTYSTVATLPINLGGTGQTTANAALNALLPTQTSNSGKYLTTDGTNASWATVASSGTVSSVGLTSANAAITVAGSPITTSGTFTVQANVFTSTNPGIVPASGGSTSNYLRGDGTWTSLPGSGTVTSVAISTTSTGLTVGGGPITTTGTLTVNINTELQGLSTLSTTGIVQRTGAGAYTAAPLSSSNAGAKFDIIIVGSPTTTVSLTNVSATAKTSSRSFVQVFRNGILQREDTSGFPNGGSFAVSATNQLTFAASLAASDEITVYQLFGA